MDHEQIANLKFQIIILEAQLRVTWDIVHELQALGADEDALVISRRAESLMDQINKVQELINQNS